MTSVIINASRRYEVYIGSGLLHDSGNIARDTFPLCRVAVVADTNVSPLYSSKVVEALDKAGFEALPYTFPAGEKSKSFAELQRLLNFLTEKNFSRTDAVFALGGGVTGDLAGFAASVFMRGIKLVQLPTTLLAAVDSSVGGKTAIDLDAGKNLCGSFYQPSAVICDTETLTSLPRAELTSGLAEVIKYGVIEGGALLNATCKSVTPELITECVRIKRGVVHSDEFDSGERRVLNLGHTAGHAAEALSGYTLRHGCAVALGLAFAARASVKLGFCSGQRRDEIIGALVNAGLDVSCPYTSQELYTAMAADKKRSGEKTALILPLDGRGCRIYEADDTYLRRFAEAGQEA